MPTTPCKCRGPGYCATHRREVSDAVFKLCHYKRGFFEAFQIAKLEWLDNESQGHPVFNPELREFIEQRLKTGPGTELVLILAGPFWRWLNIKITTGCKCLKYAKSMNRQGSDWCENNMDTVLQWLRHEHNHQRIKLPFSETVAKMLIKTAIRRARKHGSGTDRA